MLRPDDHPWSHYPHEPNRLLRRELVLVNQVRSNENACPSQTGFTVHSNFLSLVLNCVFSEPDKFADNVIGRVGAIVKKHLNVLYADVKEMAAIIEFVVESGDEADVFTLKNVQNTMELMRDGPRFGRGMNDMFV